MKNKRKFWGIGLCLAGLLAASSAPATIIQLTFDENGNSTGFTGIIHQQITDSAGTVVNGVTTVPPGGATTLDYLLPIPDFVPANSHLQSGWVAIYDDAAHTILSDLIHFDNSAQMTVNGITTTYQQIFFYSNDSDGDLADNWVSNATLTAILGSANLVKLTEGANGIAPNGNQFYIPSSGAAPGWEVGQSSSVYSYEFISSVPEPTTVLAGALLLIPLCVSAFRIIRNRKLAAV